jgi:hypothetical protein
MATVRIRHNGLYSADLIEVLQPDGISQQYEWTELDPYRLKHLLTELGHNVVMVDYRFNHDKEDPVYE